MSARCMRGMSHRLQMMYCFCRCRKSSEARGRMIGLASEFTTFGRRATGTAILLNPLKLQRFVTTFQGRRGFRCRTA